MILVPIFDQFLKMEIRNKNTWLTSLFTLWLWWTTFHRGAFPYKGKRLTWRPPVDSQFSDSHCTIKSLRVIQMWRLDKGPTSAHSICETVTSAGLGEERAIHLRNNPENYSWHSSLCKTFIEDACFLSNQSFNVCFHQTWEIIWL